MALQILLFNCDVRIIIRFDFRASFRFRNHFRVLDKRAETRLSFRRCSLFLNMTFILFFAVYFTTFLVR